jgi:hypothetical protein
VNAQATRIGKVAVLAIVAMIVVGTATAVAVTPKPGRHYEVVQQSLAVIVIQMYVDDGVITSALGNDLDCENENGATQGFALGKTVDVAKNGSFKFDGKADNTIYGSGPRKVKVSLKGKFVTSKKATGTFSIEGCAGKVSFETKYQAGKG